MLSFLLGYALLLIVTVLVALWAWREYRKRTHPGSDAVIDWAGAADLHRSATRRPRPRFPSRPRP